MSNSEGRREIKIVRDEGGNAKFAFCLCCRQKFYPKGKPFGLIEDLLWRRFMEHRCHAESIKLAS
jgi:hypothetical protein